CTAVAFVPTSRKPSKRARHLSTRVSVNTSLGELGKMSDTLLAFAAPLLGADHAMLPDDQVRVALYVAMAAWNAGAPGLPEEERAKVCDGVSSALGPHWEAMRSIYEQLLSDRQELFGYDPRLLIDFEVTRDPDGRRRILAAGASAQ